MRDRLTRIRAAMTTHGHHALITSNPANVRYATGFRGEPHTLLLTQTEAILYTSFRTLPWAEAQTHLLQSEIELSTNSAPLTDIATRLAGQKLTITVDQTLTHSAFLHLQKQLPTHTLQTSDPIERCRRLKSPAEIDLLIQSQRINESIFTSVIPQITPGMTERTVQGIMLTEIAKRDEVDGYSFAPIVAAAGNAWEIHHLPDDTIIRKNDMLLLDLGVIHQGYASDMTRTLCMGQPTAQMQNIYHTVRHAQEAAIHLMRPGAHTHQIDSAAREIITHAGHGKSFTHGLGHSIGLETHDPGLNLSPFKPNDLLLPGMAFTVEPGIYLPDAFGIRTEDVIIITEDAPKNITTQNKDLLQLNS